MSIFTNFFKSGKNQGQALTQELIRREAELASDIFGPVPKGTKRDFFCLDKNTWIWYEEWTDDAGDRKQLTTRYMVRPTEIVKSQNGGDYMRLSIEEAENFQRAAESYWRKAKAGLYDKKQKVRL